MYRDLNLNKLTLDLLNDDEKNEYEIEEPIVFDIDNLDKIQNDMLKNEINFSSLLVRKIKVINNVDYKNIKRLPKLYVLDRNMYNLLYELILNNDGFSKTNDKKLSYSNYGVFKVEKIDRKSNKVLDTYEIKSFYDYMFVEPFLSDYREELNGLLINEAITIDNKDFEHSFKIKLSEIYSKDFDRAIKKLSYINVNNFNDLKTHVLSHFKFEKDEYIKEYRNYYLQKEVRKLAKFNIEISSESLSTNIEKALNLYADNISDYQYLIRQFAIEKDLFNNPKFIELVKTNMYFDALVDYISSKENIKVSKEEIAKLIYLKKFYHRNKINQYNKLYWEEDIELIKSVKFPKEKIDALSHITDLEKEIFKKEILRKKVIDFLFDINSNNEMFNEKDIKDFNFQFVVPDLKAKNVYKLKFDDEIENIFEYQ